MQLKGKYKIRLIIFNNLNKFFSFQRVFRTIKTADSIWCTYRNVQSIQPNYASSKQNKWDQKIAQRKWTRGFGQNNHCAYYHFRDNATISSSRSSLQSFQKSSTYL